jgi:hypothetical protein
MEAQGTKRFVVDHLVVSAVAYGVAISILTVAVTLMLTGTNPIDRSGADETAAVEISVAPPVSLLAETPRSILDVQYAEQNWDVGTRSPALTRSAPALSQNQIEYMEHNWNFVDGAPLIERSILGMTAEEIAFMEQNPDFWSGSASRGATSTNTPAYVPKDEDGF